MNNTRRKTIAKALAELKKYAPAFPLILQMQERLDDVRDTIRDMADEERDAFDNLPESLQFSEKGVIAEAMADDL